MAAHRAGGARVFGAFGGGEQVLPDQFRGGVGIFPFEGVREVNLSEAGGQVFVVKEADAFDLALKGGDERIRHGGDAILFAFAVAHGDGFVLEVQIFNAQADTFHKAQARAVQELRHQFVCAVETVEDVEHFLAGEDGGKSFGTFGAGEEDGFDFLMEDFAVEKEDGAEGLVLSGGRDVPFGGEVDDVGADFVGAHLGGMFFMLEEDEAADPVEVGFFGAVGVVLCTQSI